MRGAGEGASQPGPELGCGAAALAAPHLPPGFWCSRPLGTCSSSLVSKEQGRQSFSTFSGPSLGHRGKQVAGLS